VSDREVPGPSPRVILGGGALVAAVIALAALASRQDVGRVTDAETTLGGTPVEVAEVRFEDREDGSVAVQDARTDRVVHRLPPGEGNFERGALRALVRIRKVHGIEEPGTFRLTAWRDGRLTLTDPATGTVLDLNAFGPTNVGAFARILEATRPPGDGEPAAAVPTGS
jgi:putative photosynthetic complex assembly protein